MALKLVMALRTAGNWALKEKFKKVNGGKGYLNTQRGIKMKKTTILRNLLKEPGLVVIPCVEDCLTARCAEAAGFKAACMAGSSMYDAVLGLPNIGLASANEVINIMRYIANSINIPLLVMGDDGFGPMFPAYRTTQEVIRAGAAGISISDRTPVVKTTAGHHVVEVLPRNEYLGKIGAVVEARDKEDKDFIIAARIDCGAKLGEEEVIARAKACKVLGADVIFALSAPSEPKSKEVGKENLGQFYKKLGAPDVMIWGMGPDDLTAKDYQDIGTKIWVNGRIDFIVAEAALDFYQKFHDTGTLPPQTFTAQPGKGPAADYLQKLRGKGPWSEIEKRNTH